MTKLDKWLPSLYFVIGQVGWFACVISAARGVPWVGAAVALSLVVVHVARVPRPLEELKLLACVLPISALWESALVRTGVIVYPSGVVYPGLSPYWILVVWTLFTAQFNTTYRWLKPHKLLGALLGAIAGPLSFRGGAALGALSFPHPGPALITLAVGWAILLPVVIVLSSRWDGVRPVY